MADKQYSPSNVGNQAVSIDQAWLEVGEEVVLGGVTRPEFQVAQTDLGNAENAIASAQARLTDARNQRKATRHTLWELVKRVRNGTKAQYGDDSNEYELMGGTRTSERK